MYFDLRGKKALVTGSSRGIGRGIALGLAESGADIFVNYAGNDAAAKETYDMITALGRKCTLVKEDLTHDKCAENLYNMTGDVDILVLNASIQYRKKWEEITIEEFETQINCNLRATMLLIQKYAPYMKKQKWGRIVTIGSVQEAKPHDEMLVYASSKAAQTLMAKSIAFQLAGSGITVNNIAPGTIYTDRNVEALSDENYRKVVLSKIPCGYFGKPEHFKGIIKLLCSEEGEYITGQNIFVDGGMSIK